MEATKQTNEILEQVILDIEAGSVREWLYVLQGSRQERCLVFGRLKTQLPQTHRPCRRVGRCHGLRVRPRRSSAARHTISALRKTLLQ